jgi:hypothetical protein
MERMGVMARTVMPVDTDTQLDMDMAMIRHPSMAMDPMAGRAGAMAVTWCDSYASVPHLRATL